MKDTSCELIEIYFQVTSAESFSNTDDSIRKKQELINPTYSAKKLFSLILADRDNNTFRTPAEDWSSQTSGGHD